MSSSPDDVLAALSAEFGDVSVAYAPPSNIITPSVIVIPQGIAPHSAGDRIIEDWRIMVVVGSVETPHSVNALRAYSIRLATALSTIGVRWQGADLVTLADKNNKRFLAWSNPVQFTYQMTDIVT